MTRFSLLIAAILLVSMLHAQDCPTLTCAPVTYTPYPTETGECRWPIPVSHFITSDLATCPGPVSLAIYSTDEIAAAGEGFTPEFTGRDTFWYEYPDGEETTVVQVFLQDGTGAVQVCETYLLIQMGVAIECYPQGDPIAGNIQTENDEPVANVQIDITGTIQESFVTNGDGRFLYPFFSFADSLVVTPSRDDNPLNGVSTFDVVLMTKHILGTQPLGSPYRMVAADVNQSGTITILDIIQIRKLILGVYGSFPNAPSWRFVPAAYLFPAPTNPWQETFPEMIIFDDLEENDVISGDFIGIKMGDVNGSAQGN
ncbi:MAG: hypothetical protein ACRBG0_23305 [Lewinella sp.]|uniref:hypothetical protein n=1 Tax=Lewinella sp. TaxID=2004506 RepID=UPI003D6B7E23